MAVPKTIRKSNIDRIKFVEDSADSFDAKVEDIESSIFRNIVQIINSFDVDDQGNIKKTSGNLKKAIKAKTVRNAVITPAYVKSVETYIDKYDQVRDKNNSYFKSLPENA